MPFERINNEEKRYSEIINIIKNKLIKGEILPGDKLPTEAEMVEQLGVSRTPIREAIKILEAIGIIEIKRGEGMFVQKNFSGNNLNPLIISLIIHSQDIAKLVEFRQYFENMVLDLASINCTGEDLDKLNNIYNYHSELIRNKKLTDEEWADLDLEFHYAILDATKNPFILEIGKTVYELYRHNIVKLTRKYGKEQSLNTHKLYLETLKDKSKNTELRQRISNNYRSLHNHID
ncbi:MAG: hypothetical protein JM58_01220 [Peptococcaceae bacterium BICA1-8]|nr:MAG: hypothetical protein JM58_01220 [Peptococcaceae bacterium BICA1-8]